MLLPPTPSVGTGAPQRPHRLGMDHDARELAHRREEPIAPHSSTCGPDQNIGVLQYVRFACDGLPVDDVDPGFLIHPGHANGREEYGWIVVRPAFCCRLPEHRFRERRAFRADQLLGTHAANHAVLVMAQLDRCPVNLVPNRFFELAVTLHRHCDRQCCTWNP